MAANSKIQWTDHTFNPWEGCTKVAPECKNCYAETLVDHRFGRAKWGNGQPRRRTSENLWKQPLVWNDAAKYFACDVCGKIPSPAHEHNGGFSRKRPRVFCLSLGDWLDDEVPIEWLADLLALIHATPNLDWQLLTKRPQNFFTRVEEVWADQPRTPLGGWLHDWLFLGSEPFPGNVWIGVSAGADQKAALKIPAKIHFLSCEPMLHPLDTTHAAGFDWIIFGGESGRNARPCHVQWIRDGLNFCRAIGVRAFVKQLGSHPIVQNPSDWVITGHGRRDSHGGDMSEWPEDLRVREFPETRRQSAAATI